MNEDKRTTTVPPCNDTVSISLHLAVKPQFHCLSLSSSSTIYMPILPALAADVIGLELVSSVHCKKSIIRVLNPMHIAKLDQFQTLTSVFPTLNHSKHCKRAILRFTNKYIRITWNMRSQITFQ